MPASTEKQRKLFGAALAAKRGNQPISKKVADIAASTSEKELSKMASKDEGAGYGYDDQVGQIFVVQKPYDGCQADQLVHQFDPIAGIQGMGLDPTQVHGMYTEDKVAMQMAEAACNQYMQEAMALEEKKSTVGEKVKKAIDQLEKKRKEHVQLAKEEPSKATEHREHIAKLASKIDDLMSKLEKIEKSKKQIEKDEDKKEK